ncbi:MAG TPA: hypothetical protein VHY09_09440 [Candidatus Methylacidiphilales bacterium]|nr:hypothetical protein [Candidatus Methylacidiphilales bacterium]
MTANPKPSAEAARRAAIKHRRETSAFWMAVHLLGSLNVAVVLLVTIAAMIAFATIMESRFDTAVARYYIYDNPLFTLWLVVLALNLLCAALTRWPWQRKHVGFVVTHAGIILMLTGAMVGRAWGFEAFVTLDKTKAPAHQLITKDDVLTIGTSDGLRGEIPFDIDIRPPTEARPFTLPLENSPLKLVVDRATDKLVPDDTLRASDDTAAPAGIALHFVNAGMNQNVAANLMLDDDDAVFDFFGMAKVTMVDSLDEAHPIALPKPTEPAPAPPAVRDETPFHETQVVFANSPQSTIVDTDSDARSGYVVTLAASPGKPDEFEATVTGPSGVSKTLPVKDAGKDWTNLLGDGDPIFFRVAKYWPDFAMKDNVPTTLSDQPRHPVVLVQISGPSKSLPPAPPKPAQAAPPMPKGLAMRVAPAKEPGKIVYELEREGKIEARGIAAAGDMIPLGWSKWEAKVDAVLPHAEVHREMKEFAGEVTPMMAASLRPGIRAHIVAPDGTSGPVEWIPSGAARELFAGRDYAWIGFGQRVIPLTYNITLEDFQVPRDEGTDTPSNYISSLRFNDPISGREVRGTASMNSPAMFPGDFWRSLLGWNYKFSQANWNPDNLNETTLQVLYDPGWPFKWTGSLGICIGIALMFYFMPKRSAAERGGREDEPDEDAAKQNEEKAR